MIAIALEDIQQDLLHYLQQVEGGETVIILRADQPVAELKPVTPQAKARRPFGLCTGEFTVPEDFGDPLPEDMLSQFEAS